MSELLPDGIDDVRDIPHVLFNAVRRALVFLSFSELPRDEQPPRHIWLDDDKLKSHFDRVDRERKAKYGGDGGAGPIEDPVDNQAAAALIVE